MTTSARHATGTLNAEAAVGPCAHRSCSAPFTLSSDENSLQSSLKCSTILVPCWTPLASAISNTPELRVGGGQRHRCDSLKRPSLGSCSHRLLLSPVRGPLVSRCVGLGRLAVDVDAVGHHEGRIESHPELTDDGAAGLSLVLQGIQERLRTQETVPIGWKNFCY